MFKEGTLDKILQAVKSLIPKPVFDFFAPLYHTCLAYLGAVIYGFPSKKIKVIGVTGTKGKSTVVYLITKILEGSGKPVAAIGSLGFKINDKEWPNTLKMTMPGRFKIHKFLKEAVDAGCKYAVMEVTSEGIVQKRHLGINFDCAVFTNLHKEHLEVHGSFENYYSAKQTLFRRTVRIQVLNSDDSYFELFSKFPSEKKIFYGIQSGDLRAADLVIGSDRSSFSVYGTDFNIGFGGSFNVSNSLAALATVAMYNIDLPTAKPILESIKNIPGRMEWIQKEPFGVVIDYAHTPESLELVYKTLKESRFLHKASKDAQDTRKKLVCVLGAAGGGRDKWKRPEFGKIADKYCNKIILTNEDPYDEDPEKILDEVQSGISKEAERIIDRKKAIAKAIKSARKGDIVVITGKGSETTMAVAGGKKIPWSEKKIVEDMLHL